VPYVRALGAAILITGAVTASAVVAHTQTVDDLVARNLAAKGGAEALRALTSVKMRGRIKGPAGVEPVTMWAKRPNLRRRENVRDGQTFVLGFDGKTVWGINPLVSARPREITGPQAEMTRRDADDFDSLLLDYKSKGRTVELVATEPVQGITMHRLRVTAKSGAIQEIYLNADTMLESKMVMQIEQGGRKGIVAMEFSNYKTIDGITMPLHIRQTFNGLPMTEVTYDEVQFNVPMEDGLFRMPTSLSPASPAASRGSRG
jgi:outer membrane lipoprotein-sorting protein